jgi:hypothetical protein
MNDEVVDAHHIIIHRVIYLCGSCLVATSTTTVTEDNHHLRHSFSGNTLIKSDIDNLQ